MADWQTLLLGQVIQFSLGQTERFSVVTQNAFRSLLHTFLEILQASFDALSEKGSVLSIGT